jgi:hypothetical protein
MRTKVKRIPPVKSLMRILDALAQEAIEASDGEVTEAATDLGMDLRRRDSAAFAGLTYFSRPQLSDFFDLEVSKRLQAPTEPNDTQRGSKQPQIPTASKPSDGK